MENSVDAIKQKLDIVSYIGSFIPLKKTGRNFKALCPFHQEHTPSFIVSPDRQIWHCFGSCQEGGDIFKFLMKWENLTFSEALKELAEKAGVKLTKMNFDDKLWQKKEKLITINSLAAEYFEYILQKSRFGEQALEYLKNRSLSQNTIKKFQLGYAPRSWDSLLRFLKKKKYDDADMLESGLLVKGVRGSLYDRFRGRILFPIKDTRGNIIGFSGRTLDINAKEAKYINTPETPLYHKRETLYGLNLAKDSVKQENNIFLVEGEFDMITPYQAGITNVAAIKGSAVTREQLMYLKRYTDRITLALDSDNAGEESMKKAILEAEELEFSVGTVTFDYAKDPDEAVKKDMIRFKKLIKNPQPFYDFIIELSQNKYPTSDPYGKKQFAEEVSGYVGRIKNPIVRSHYSKKIAVILDVSENSVESIIRMVNRKRKPRFAVSSQKKSAVEMMREVVIQKYLLSIIFQNRDPFKLTDKIFKIFSLEDFSLPAYQKICQLLLNYRGKSKQFNLEEFGQKLNPELRSTFDELFLFASTEIDIKNEKIEKLVYEAKKFSLKRKISQLIKSDESDEEKIKKSLRSMSKELSDVEKKMITL